MQSPYKRSQSLWYHLMKVFTITQDHPFMKYEQSPGFYVLRNPRDISDVMRDGHYTTGIATAIGFILVSVFLNTSD